MGTILKGERIAWIDVAKAILIFLVVLGHSPISVSTCNSINSFHMAAFFCLSGFTFSFKGDLRGFVKKKVKGILVPYLEFSVILLAFFFLRNRFLHSGGFNLIEGLTSIFIPISGRPTTSVYGLWFLPCLFLAEICIAFVMNYYHKSYGKWLALLVTTLLVLAIGSYTFGGIASIVSVLPIAIFFVWLGMWLKRHMTKYAVITCCLSTLSLVVLIYLNTVWLGNNLDMSSMYLGNLPLYLCSGVAGSVAVIYSSTFFTKVPYLQSFGRDSLYIYGLHFCVMPIAIKLLHIRGGHVQFSCYSLPFPSLLSSRSFEK